jgi:hypothetical protein
VKRDRDAGPFHISCPKVQRDFHCISIGECHKITITRYKIS